MKEKKSTKMYANNENGFLKQIRINADNAYYLEVLYYYVRRALITYDYNLKEVDGFVLNGRFLGYKQEILIPKLYNTPLESLGLAMSIRAFMIDKNYINKCYNNRLLFNDLNTNLISWNAHWAIMDCIKDDDFHQIYEMVCSYKTNHRLTDEQKELFKKNTIRPDYRHFDKYCQSLAGDPDYHGESIIKNNAFLYDSFEKYVIPEVVDYVGNTAFAYCNKLEKLVFEGKVLFGSFPIIECPVLKQIIVPTDLLSYYKESLPYYKSIITDTENDKLYEDKEESIAIPSLELQHEPIKIQNLEHERKPIETNLLDTIFDKKATSYKYFWFMAIISLAKERDCLAIPYKDILIRMTAMAWPIIFDYEIELSKSDMLPRYLEEITKKTKLIKQASSKVVETYLTVHYNSQGVDKILAPLLKNVPYRFLSPWIPFTTNEDVVEKSNSNNYGCPYALHDNEIVLDEDWWEYIKKHYSQICDFSKNSFVKYTKANNNHLKLMKFMLEGWSLIK